MSIVFVIATDWILRAAVRAELRELGIDALGMDSPDEAGRALSANENPDAIVLEATADLIGNPAIQNLIKRVPTVVIASRTESLPSFATEAKDPNQIPSAKLSNLSVVGMVTEPPAIAKSSTPPALAKSTEPPGSAKAFEPSALAKGSFLLYRPVTIREIVDQVRAMLARPPRRLS